MITFTPTRYSPPGIDLSFGWQSNIGLIPSFFSDLDPRPAKEQINERYAFGGGWHPFPSFVVVDPADPLVLQGHPEDPPLYAIAEAKLRDETIRLYEPGSWLAIFQPDGTFEVSRCD